MLRRRKHDELITAQGRNAVRMEGSARLGGLTTKNHYTENPMVVLIAKTPVGDSSVKN